MRRFGDPARSDKHYTRRPGAYGILLRGQDLLLTHQMAPEPEFQLPGGGVDPGESPLQALRREVGEETGWIIDAPRRIGAYRRYCYMPEYDHWAEKICMIYLARPVRAHSAPREPGHSAIWMPAAEAAAHLASSGDAAVLRRVLREWT